MATPNIETIIRDHVTLTVDCIDRLYLNGYVPRLQTPGQIVGFLGEHLGNPVPSPALLRPLHDRFVRDVTTFADAGKIPVVQFERGQRKDDIAAEHRARFTKPEGVVFIGVAQERASAFKARKLTGNERGVLFEFSRQSVFVNHYYFYVQDREWGPGFVKVGTYLPHPVRVCLNGHEWAKQQARQVGLGFTSLDNGFLACEDPERLQAICAGLGPTDVQRFFDRWSAHLPWPLTPADRAAGYQHRLSIWQLEVSRTQVFDQPVQGRHFFEAVIRENLDLGRPDRISLLFPKRITRRTPAPAHGYRTRVITTGIAPSLHIDYKHTDVKQYFKEERALRTETTINDPTDFQSKKALETLPQLRATGARINEQVLAVERVSHACSLSQDALAQLQTPRQQDGQRIPALRFGDPRVVALLQALCGFAHLPAGFRNRDLRPHVAALLGRDLATYSRGAMTYDLRRLRLHGLIERVPRTHRYTLTSFGLRVAFFCSKVYLRVLRPGSAAVIDPPDDLPHPLRDALRRLDQAIDQLCAAAHLHSEAA
jgi:hypothetical protein